MRLRLTCLALYYHPFASMSSWKSGVYASLPRLRTSAENGKLKCAVGFRRGKYSNWKTASVLAFSKLQKKPQEPQQGLLGSLLETGSKCGWTSGGANPTASPTAFLQHEPPKMSKSNALDPKVPFRLYNINNLKALKSNSTL